MIGLCLKEMRVDRTGAVYVGDMVLDVESAACAGLPAILVAGGSSTRDELAQTGQTVIGSLRDLLSLLPDRPSAD